MTAIEDRPLPASLALPDEEPISEESLDWIAQRLTEPDSPPVATVLAEAAEFYDREEAGDSDGTVEMLPREVVRFTVDDDMKAQWAMAKLAEIEAEGNRVTELADEWVAKYERWREERLRPLNARHAYMTHLLTSYLRRLREADPKCKSRPLPSGDIVSRAIPAKIEVVDENAVIQWATDNDIEDDIVKTVETVRLTEFRKVVTIDEEAGVVRDKNTGQPIDGVKVAPSGISFSVRVGG